MLSVITIHLTKHMHPLFFIPIYHFSYHLFHKVFPFLHSSVTNQRVLRVRTCVVLPPDFVKHRSAVSCDYYVAGWHSSEQQGSEQAYSPFPPSENIDSNIVEDCQLQTTYDSDELHLHRINVH